MKHWLGCLLGILLAAGCADATFELLPPPSKAPPEGTAGRPDPSKGGMGATSGIGAMSGSGGTGGAGVPDGGNPNPCEYDPAPDCRPCRLDVDCDGTANPYCSDTWEKCVQCREDRDCEGTPNRFCSPTAERCVPCRVGFDCPPHESCEDDCEQGERCAALPVPRCGYDCRFGPCTQSPDFPHCDGGWKVCTECDPDPRSPDNDCPGELVCNLYGMCVRCAVAADCTDPALPACNPYTFECQACRDDSGCDSKGPCDVQTGRCGPPAQGP